MRVQEHGTSSLPDPESGDMQHCMVVVAPDAVRLQEQHPLRTSLAQVLNHYADLRELISETS